jgi:hypothetical protein
VSSSHAGRRAAKQKLAEELLNEYVATLTLGGQFSRSAREAQAAEKNMLETATNAQLDTLIPQMEKRLQSLRDRLGAQESGDFYQKLLAGAALGEEHFLYVPRWMLEALFSKSGDSILHIPSVPRHALVQIDVNGLLDDGSMREYRVLEASLYEDMALMFNRVLDLEQELDSLHQKHRILKEPEQKKTFKELAAARRACVSSAFYFVEAYLNSLAFEALITRSTELSQQDLERLTEWSESRNEGKGADKYLTLRDKCLHYPRLVAGKQHPLLDENNSPALARFLSEFKELRDSIVHASAVPRQPELGLDKEQRFLLLNTKQCGEIVDVSIELVGKIEEATYGHRNRVIWLVPRDSTGRFPMLAFA